MKKILFFICMGVLALTSCEKDPDFAELDSAPAVYTNYAENTKFGDYQTFYIPDSILEVKTYKCEAWDDGSAKKVIAYVVKLMEERGYTRTYKKNEADLGILLSHLQDINIVYGSWWDYYYWDYYYWDPYYSPWWGGWYYPATVSYAYQTNSVIMDMADMKDKRTTITGEVKPRLKVVWTSQIDAYNFDAQTVKKSIDQAFEQSSYINTDK